MGTAAKDSRLSSTNPVAVQPAGVSVRKFYFLEYFYILLESVARYRARDQVFGSFKLLKQQRRLGESKFRRVTADPENLTPKQLGRYKYTFEQVVDEAKQYKLIQEDDGGLSLTAAGAELHGRFGTNEFARILFALIEQNGSPFRSLITRMYLANPANPGLLVFPIYSPRQLHFDRVKFHRTADVRSYGDALAKRLERDMDDHLNKRVDLRTHSAELVHKLVEAGLLSGQDSAPFDADKYNAIVSRFRKYWLNYFLREVYGYEVSLSLFDILVYRGKEFGIIHATEFYPGFSGRVVFPTSVILSGSDSADFEELYKYPDSERLYSHKPGSEEKGQDRFVDFLVQGYLSLRRTHRSYFVSVSALRELVCYNMKISEGVFESLLDHAYKHLLSGQLRISMSLEVDRLPEETKAMYLKQVPVCIDGKPRNIIAIDVTSVGGDRYGQAHQKAESIKPIEHAQQV
jgi:hypothetical protein